jgi:hypothetical protein
MRGFLEGVRVVLFLRKGTTASSFKKALTLGTIAKRFPESCVSEKRHRYNDLAAVVSYVRIASGQDESGGFKSSAREVPPFRDDNI